MKAFISYSHKDSKYLERLHVHLAQLKRENFISTWTDNDILAGGALNSEISNSLSTSEIFIALLSPDYISSDYCYHKEFEKAIQMQKADDIIIIPIVLEDCDWKNTPFQNFKALPKDGKPISTWANINTAFLNVIEEIRKVLKNNQDITSSNTSNLSQAVTKGTRNYKVKKDFDSIQKSNFQEESFVKIKQYLKDFTAELESLENINAKVVNDTSKEIEVILVNRNKIQTECTIKIDIKSDSASNQIYRSMMNSEQSVNVKMKTKNGSQRDFMFTLDYDDYELYWTIYNFHSYSQNENYRLSVKEIADVIWETGLKEIGIEF